MSDVSGSPVDGDDRGTEPDPAVEANVEELYGDGDERAGVATMPTEERDRLLGDDAPPPEKPEIDKAPQPGDDAPLDDAATE